MLRFNLHETRGIKRHRDQHAEEKRKARRKEIDRYQAKWTFFLKTMALGLGALETKTIPKQSKDKVAQSQCHENRDKHQQIQICSEKESLI